jgi:hypothetical protein
VTEGEGYIGGSLSGTTGNAGAGVGPLADAAPDQSRDAAGQASYAFWLGKGLAPHQAAGMAAQEVAESGGRPGIPGDNGQAFGLYQHHPDRRALILAKAGIDMNKPDANTQREGAYWELMNSEHEARRRLFASKDPDEAGRAATEFERPDSKRRAIIDAERGRDARRIFMLANPNGAAGVATASVDPNAGPRVGLTPPPAVAAAPAITPPRAVGDNPNGPAPTPPTVTGQADDPNTAAVKQASAALLNMPEADAAAAYPAVVKELQARGFAMQAPPTYPGHAALQALVGGVDAVAQTKTAMRLGGTDVAGPGAGQATVPPEVQPNRMAYGTGLPGVTIGMPGNGLAPPPTAAAPSPVQTAAAPAQAQPQAASPQPIQPPPAPSRAIQREPLLSNNLTASQQDAARRAIRAGTPLATVQAHVEQWKQENVAARHQDAVDAAAEQQANYARQEAYRKAQIEAENTQYTRGRQSEQDKRAAEELAIRQAAEKRAADEAAAKAADPLQGKSEDERIERTLLQIAPKLRPGYSGPPPTDAEKDQYTLLWNKFREGPLQQVPDGKGGFFTARVPRDVPPDFPPPPGQKVSAGPQPIPGTEKMPDLAPATITGGMLENGVGQRKLMSALTNLQAHPDAVGIKANAPDWLLQRTDPEGVRLRGDISDVAGHEFHTLSGAAVSASEASRLKFIPSEKDTAEALKTKLSRLLEMNRETMLQSYRTYGPENGFRRVPAVEEAIIDSIPQVSIDMLKDKPETAKQFDKAFGKGAAKLVLQHGG